jgi:hypothetical protein
MTPMTVVTLSALLTTSFLVGQTGTSGVTNEQAISAVVKGRDQGKGHFCTVDLRLKNLHDYPVWFLISKGNEVLRYDAHFYSDYRPDPMLTNKLPFGAEEYNEGRGSAIIVDHYGRNGFRAILLPAKGELRFQGFEVYAFDPPRVIDIWEAKSLKVNGKTPLEEWLPYPVTSSTSVEIKGRMYSGKQRVLGHDQKPQPTEEVKTIVCEPLSRQIVP